MRVERLLSGRYRSVGSRETLEQTETSMETRLERGVSAYCISRPTPTYPPLAGEDRAPRAPRSTASHTKLERAFLAPTE